MLKKSLLLISLLVYTPILAYAHAPQPTNNALEEPSRIHFEMNAQEKVAGNQMKAMLRLETKHKQPAAAARELNLKLQEAMQKLKSEKDLRVETSQYSTAQLFDEKGRPKEWQVSVDLTLCSENWTMLNDMIGQLQSKNWLFAGVMFEVSQEQRKTIEAKLTQKALADWSEQAQKMAQQLQLKRWKISNINIAKQNTDRPSYAPEYRMKAVAMDAEAAAAPTPNLAGAETVLSVTVRGELIAE
jgi:predicted secreted protein